MRILVLPALLVLAQYGRQGSTALISLLGPVQAVAPSLSAGFMSRIKTLFGSGSEFAQRYGMHYGDVYNNQLMLSAYNAYKNHSQKEVEKGQTEIMKPDLAVEKFYFHFLIGCILIMLICMIFGAILSVRKLCRDKIRYVKQR